MSDRRSTRLDMVYTLLAPLHHGAGTEGNVAVMRRQRVVVGDRVEDLPVLSGNAIKHVVFREPGVRHMLRTLGVKDGDLTRPVVHLLFSGGALTTKGSVVDVAAYRALCEAVPILGLLGGALGNTMMRSRLSVGHGIPLCEEYGQYVPLDRLREAGLFVESNLLPAGALQDVQMGTRHDPLRDPSVRRLLGRAAQLALDGGQAATLAKRQKGEHAADDETQQMIFEREVLAMGATLWSEVHLVDATEMEEAALWSAIREWMQRPYLGACSSVGNGRCRLRIAGDRPAHVAEPAFVPVEVPLDQEDIHPEQARAEALIGAYEASLRGRRAEILNSLRGVAA